MEWIQILSLTAIGLFSMWGYKKIQPESYRLYWAYVIMLLVMGAWLFFDGK